MYGCSDLGQKGIYQRTNLVLGKVEEYSITNGGFEKSFDGFSISICIDVGYK